MKNSWVLREKLWPLIAKLECKSRQNVQNIIQKIQKQLEKEYCIHSVVQTVNEVSRMKAMNLWRPTDPSDKQKHDEISRNVIQAYNGLMESLNFLLNNDEL